MGTHSGTSSDDLIFVIGYQQPNQAIIVTYNKERHGIKSMINTELKTEKSISFYRNLSRNNTFFVSIEKEIIDNFGFIEKSTSVSNLDIIFHYGFLSQFFS